VGPRAVVGGPVAGTRGSIVTARSTGRACKPGPAVAGERAARSAPRASCCCQARRVARGHAIACLRVVVTDRGSCGCGDLVGWWVGVRWQVRGGVSRRQDARAGHANLGRRWQVSAARSEPPASCCRPTWRVAREHASVCLRVAVTDGEGRRVRGGDLGGWWGDVVTGTKARSTRMTCTGKAPIPIPQGGPTLAPSSGTGQRRAC
jgi:hypothetical protein